MLYEYKCVSCARLTELFRSVAKRNDPADCEFCGDAATKIMSIPQRAWGLKAQNEMYPMANPFLSKRGEPPVVFENASERKKYYSENGLVDAVTPEAEAPTMYTNDADCENYKDFDKFSQAAEFVDVPTEWEKQ